MAEGVRGFLNNYSDTLDGSITDVATSIDVVDASVISTLLATVDYVALTIDDGTDIEIVHCTGVSTNTLTVERGVEGTTGTAFDSGVVIECRLSTQGLKDSNIWIPVERHVIGSGGASELDIDVSGLTGSVRIDYRSLPETSSDAFHLQQGTSGGIQTTTYYYGGLTERYSGAGTNRGSNQSQMVLNANCGNNTQQFQVGYVEFENVDLNIKHNIRYEDRQAYKLTFGLGSRDNAEIVETLRFKYSTGDIAENSVFTVYVKAVEDSV